MTRITDTNQPAKAFDGSLLGRDTNSVVPLIDMNSVPLDTALTAFAKEAHLKVVIDPGLSSTFQKSDGRMILQPMITIHWSNLTVRQALSALCENYDLVLAKDTATDAIRIKYRNK